jgi:hypothetical protein
VPDGFVDTAREVQGAGCAVGLVHRGGEVLGAEHVAIDACALGGVKVRGLLVLQERSVGMALVMGRSPL